MNRPVLAFCGAAGAGKDSVAKSIADFGVVRYGFARPLKNLCARLFGWDESQLDELDYKESVSGHVPPPLEAAYIEAVIDDQFPNAGNPTFREAAGHHLYAILSAIHPEWTRRRILQWVGTEGFRHLNKNHWTERAFVGVRQLLAQPDVAGVALTDLRFLNEAEELRREFPGTGFVIRVDRLDDGPRTSQSGHVSEQEWDRVVPDFKLAARFGELPALYTQMGLVWTEIQERIA
jgi:hypothetical protein